jgi:hypothetical protein
MAQIGETVKTIEQGVTDFCDRDANPTHRLDGIVRIAALSPVTNEFGDPGKDAETLAIAAGLNCRLNFDLEAMMHGGRAVLAIANKHSDPTPLRGYLKSFNGRFGPTPKNTIENTLDDAILGTRLPRTAQRQLFELGKAAGVIRPSTRVLFKAVQPYDELREAAIRRHWQYYFDLT